MLCDGTVYDGKDSVGSFHFFPFAMHRASDAADRFASCVYDVVKSWQIPVGNSQKIQIYLLFQVRVDNERFSCQCALIQTNRLSRGRQLLAKWSFLECPRPAAENPDAVHVACDNAAVQKKRLCHGGSGSPLFHAGSVLSAECHSLTIRC